MATKILFVYNNAFGQYPILYEYCINLFQEGYEIYYIGVAATEEEFMSPEGIHVHHLSSRDAKPAWKLASLINRFCRQINPAIIHVFHFRWCYLLPLKSIFLRIIFLTSGHCMLPIKKGNTVP